MVRFLDLTLSDRSSFRTYEPPDTPPSRNITPMGSRSAAPFSGGLKLGTDPLDPRGMPVRLLTEMLLMPVLQITNLAHRGRVVDAVVLQPPPNVGTR